jgi:hypothetical protein
VLAALKNALNAAGGLVGYSGNIGAASGASLNTPAGTAAAPTLSVGNGTTGFYSVSTTGFGVAVNGVNKFDYGVTTAGHWQLAASVDISNVIYLNMTSGTVVLPGTGGNLTFSNNAVVSYASTLVANISCLAAGVIGVGTGTAGSAAGTISAANHRHPTAATFPASPTIGDIASVSTATAPAIGSAITLGGAAFALGVYNGAQWTCIGK